jgi:glyceraldehyde 3-phosphate dehydrogenase
MVFRAAAQNFHDVEVVGIDDLLEPDYLAYMLKHDSVHGRFKGEVSVDGRSGSANLNR